MSRMWRYALAVLAASAPLAPAFAQEGRLSLSAQPYMTASATSSTLYYVGLDGASIASLSLSSLNGLNDIYRDGTTLCAVAWSGSTPPSPGTCTGTYIGTINPVSGTARCDLTRGYARRCDVWNFYNRVPLTLEIGADVNTPTPPSWGNVNGWFSVPGDRAVRYFWTNSNYNGTVMIGRPVERARVEVRAVTSLYTHNNYSPGTGLLFYQIGIGVDGLPSTSADYCGFISIRARHIDASVTTSREVSDDGAPAAGICYLPFFQGVKTVYAAESAGDSGLVLSSGARWSFQMFALYSY